MIVSTILDEFIPLTEEEAASVIGETEGIDN
jgi:hypothetical protein